MYGIPEHCQPLSAAEEQVLLAVWSLPPACHPAGHRRKAGCQGLGPGHSAQSSCIGWKKRAG